MLIKQVIVKLNPKLTMWIDVKDKEAILPSMSKVILVTDGQRPQLVTVEKFLETVDAPYNTWTHWMEIPKIDENQNP